MYFRRKALCLIFVLLAVITGCNQSTEKEQELPNVSTIFDEYINYDIGLGRKINESRLPFEAIEKVAFGEFYDGIISSYNIERNNLLCVNVDDFICVKTDNSNVSTGMIIIKSYGGSPLNPNKIEDIFPSSEKIIASLQEKYGNFECEKMSQGKISYLLKNTKQLPIKIVRCKSSEDEPNIEVYVDATSNGADIVALYNFKYESKVEKLGGVSMCYSDIAELNYNEDEKNLIETLSSLKDIKYDKSNEPDILTHSMFQKVSLLCSKYKDEQGNSADDYKEYCFCQLAANYGLSGAQGSLADSYEYGTSVIDINMKKAKKWHIEAVKTGQYPPSMYKLAVINKEEKNISDAIYWYGELAKINNPMKRMRFKSYIDAANDNLAKLKDTP